MGPSSALTVQTTYMRTLQVPSSWTSQGAQGWGSLPQVTGYISVWLLWALIGDHWMEMYVNGDIKVRPGSGAAERYSTEHRNDGQAHRYTRYIPRNA